MFIRQHIAAAVVSLFGSVIGIQYLQTTDAADKIAKTDPPSVAEVNRIQMSVKPVNGFDLSGTILQTDINIDKYKTENVQYKPKPKPKHKLKPKPKSKTKVKSVQNTTEEMPDWLKR